MKKYNYYMYALLLLVTLTTGNVFSMEQGSDDEGAPQEKIIDLNINLLQAVNNYREHCGRIKHDNNYDPLAVFRVFMWRNANDSDLILIGPSNDKQLLRYSSLRIALQACIQNNTLSYDEIMQEIRNYGQRHY